MNRKLLSLIREQIRDLDAYHVPDAGAMVKLDAMENPYRLAGDLDGDSLDQWRQALTAAAINRYPDPSARPLKRTLERVMAVPDSRAMMLGNGSDELIQILAMSVAGGCLMSFEPGFVMYRMIAQFVGKQYVGVPLTENFTIDVEATRAAIEQHRPAIIFIAYPNNPTGNLFDEQAIEAIIDMAPGFVVIDEAYHPFAQKTFMPMLERYEHLLVMRTVSKMGLAGLRLGMLCGLPELIAEFDKVRLPYNINVLTQVSAQFALEHVEQLDKQAALIREQREYLQQQMNAMKGLRVYPSQANFILFRIEQGDADAVFRSLCDDGILIKNLNAASGPLKNCLRVTVGTPEENEVFLGALRKAH